MKKFLLNLLKVLFVIRDVILIPFAALIYVVGFVVSKIQMGMTLKQYVRYRHYGLTLAYKYLWEIEDLRLTCDYIDRWKDAMYEYCKREGL